MADAPDKTSFWTQCLQFYCCRARVAGLQALWLTSKMTNPVMVCYTAQEGRHHALQPKPKRASFQTIFQVYWRLVCSSELKRLISHYCRCLSCRHQQMTADAISWCRQLLCLITEMCCMTIISLGSFEALEAYKCNIPIWQLPSDRYNNLMISPCLPEYSQIIAEVLLTNRSLYSQSSWDRVLKTTDTGSLRMGNFEAQKLISNMSIILSL